MACDVLIVGGDGDLAFRKLYPALYQLDAAGQLPKTLQIVSTARAEVGKAQFIRCVRDRLQTEMIDEGVWERFVSRLCYMQADATSAHQLAQLATRHLSDAGRDLVVYLATPPGIFAPVCKAVRAAGLVRPSTRIVVEKPLGTCRQSFREINSDLTELFEERQVYRIDHYLGKEAVQNLLALRFSNSLFEPLWNNNYIDHVQITVAETVGVEGRWDFYDAAGAMKDMMQNHVLQLLCLVAMEPPPQLEAHQVRDEKLKVLRCLKAMSVAEVRANTVRGQYKAGAVLGKPVPGFTEEVNARSSSTTETFIALKAQIDNWRWRGVPFYLRTGKRMPRRFSEIVIQFKDVKHSIFGAQEQISANRLIIRLQPDEGIQLQLMNKVPGLDSGMRLQPVSLNLSYSQIFLQGHGPDAYERLLFDVIRDNSTLFVRADEVDAAWQWVDGIIENWRAVNKSLALYTAGSWGPSEAIALIARDGRSWVDGE